MLTGQKRRLSSQAFPDFQLNTYREWRAFQIPVDIFIQWHIKHHCSTKPQNVCCLCANFVCFLHTTSMTCWCSNWRCGKLAVFTSHRELIILLPFWLAELMPDNFHMRLGCWTNRWKAKQHQSCAPHHFEGQAIRSQLMSPGKFIHFGLHPSANRIMTEKQHLSAGCANFLAKSPLISPCVVGW